MPRRESALKGSAWLIVALTVLGFGFLVRKVFFTARAELTRSLQEPRPEPRREDPPAHTAEAVLAKCREAASADGGQVDWALARVACVQAVRFNPYDTGLSSLLRHVESQADCAAALAKARGFADAGQAEQASFALTQVLPECDAKVEADLLAAELEPTLVARAAAQCEKRAKGPRPVDAFEACERYVELAYCPDLSALQPPAGKELDLYGELVGKDKKRAWKPRDPRLVDFLIAKQRAHPLRGEWRCTTHFELGEPAPPNDGLQVRPSPWIQRRPR